ncbi:MAG: ester cyclase [Chlamydiota bacterium]
MANQEAQKMVKELFDEVFNKGNLNYLDQCIDKNVKFYDPSAPNFRGGLQAFKQREQAYQRAFPNKQCTVDDIFTSDDKIVVRWTVKGVHGGDLPGIKKTGNKIEITGIMILKTENNTITEIWQSWDRLGLLEQLGQVKPEPAAALS